MKQKIGIIGVGVVGSAVKRAFEPIAEVIAYDKAKPELGDFDQVVDANVIFVCVPTFTNKMWDQDLGPLEEVCGLLNNANYKGVVISKCTTLPGVTKKLAEKYKLRMVHSPEFLTAAKSYEDFINQKAILLGGDEKDIEDVVPVFKLLNEETPIVKFASAETSEMAKYVHNLFLATKVSFFNDIYDACRILNLPYDHVMQGVHAIGQVGKGHTKVPGPDGHFGYGGACFSKDAYAFLKFSEMSGIHLPVLGGAVWANKERHPDEKKFRKETSV